MEEFESVVRELTDWWNSGQGTTCEFSTNYDNIEEKFEILKLYSSLLKSGVWAVHKCSCCEGYNAEAPLHVMIWK